MILDFTLCACRRPELLERTLLSFAKNLRGVDLASCRCFLNVDPVPDDRNSEAVIAVAQTFFGEVLHTCPQTPSFPAAVKRLFLQPETAWAIHLEEDWILTQEVHIDDLMAVDARVINLRAHAHFRKGLTRCFLSPGLWDTMLMADVGEQMNDWENPECQLWRLTDRLGCGHYYGDYPLVRDIGREWLEGSGWEKDTPKPERGIHSWTHWKGKQ